MNQKVVTYIQRSLEQAEHILAKLSDQKERDNKHNVVTADYWQAIADYSRDLLCIIQKEQENV